MDKARFIEVSAEVRYWEDAIVNGKEDSEGTMIPCRNGVAWEPDINLETGHILNWPEGTEASIHYKVCDAGEYWLLNESMERIAKWRGCYVPDEILCIEDRGYGDYIIFRVGPDGNVIGWKNPSIDSSEWVFYTD